MKPKEVIAYFRACKDQIEEETKTIRPIWEQCLNQYLCNKDFGPKEKWQFKTYVPISKPKIKRAVRLIKRILLGTNSYFDFQHYGEDELKKKQCTVTRRALRAHLAAGKFIDHAGEAIESGFTLALMILKITVADAEGRFTIDPETDELVRRIVPKLSFKAINPFNFFFSRDRKIVIENEWITLPELKELANEKDANGEFIYDRNEIKKSISKDYGDPQKFDEELEKRLRQLGLYKHDNAYRKDVLLSHFWGPLINKNNEMVKGMENCRFTLVNEQYVILRPKDNPFWHKKPPYVWGSPLNVLFRHIGKGLMEDIRGIEDAIIDFINLQLDNLMWQMLGVREVDPMALSEAGKADLRELYPGKLVERRTGYSGEAFKFHELGVNPDKAMPVLQELLRFMEGEHGITPYVEAQEGAASEKATIYAGKKAQAMTDFQSIATDIERGFIVDCIDMSRDLMVQFLSDFDSYPNIRSIVGAEGIVLDELTEGQRKAMIVTDLDIVGRGISVFFDRMEKIEKFGSFVKMVNALPDDSKLYVPWDELIKAVFEMFAFDKLKLRTEDDVRKMRQARAQEMQQAKMLAIQEFMAPIQADMAKQDKDNQMKMIELKHEGDQKEKDRQTELLKILLKEYAGGGTGIS